MSVELYRQHRFYVIQCLIRSQTNPTDKSAKKIYRQIGPIEKWIVAGTKKVIDVSIIIELTFNNLRSKENFEI